MLFVVIVQSLSRVQLFATPWTAERQPSLSFTISRNLFKLMSIEWVMPSNHVILCHPLLLLPSIFPSIRVFSNELALCIRWPKYWSFSFSISLSNEYSGVISFMIDWLDLLAVQGTLKSLLQHYSSKASILWCSAFFIVQLSHLCMTIGKTIALTLWPCRQSNVSAFFFFNLGLSLLFFQGANVFWIHFEYLSITFRFNTICYRIIHPDKITFPKSTISSNNFSAE